MKPHPRFAIGVDVGVSPDRSCIVYGRLHRYREGEDGKPTGEEMSWSPWQHPNKRRAHLLFDLLGCELYTGRYPTEIAQRVKEIRESPQLQTHARLSKTWDETVHYIIEDQVLPPSLGVDASGVGHGLYGDMRNEGIAPLYGYRLTGGFEEGRSNDGVKNIPKMTIYGNLITAFEKGWIRVAAGVESAEQIRHELTRFTWKQTRTGRTTVENESAKDHDDTLAALGVCLRAALDEIHNWRNRALPSGTYSERALGLRR